MRDTDAELDRVDDLMTVAYGTTSRRRELVLYLAAQPDGWFVIEQDRQIVAAAGCIAYGPFCWLGLVATHPSARGRGLASRISQHLVDWSVEHGCDTVALDASELGRPIYERLGFEATGWTIELGPDPERLVQAGPRAERCTPEDLAAILALDPAIFGGDRTALLRTFASSCSDACFVTRSATGGVSGYLFARERLIGPGLAADAEAASSLVRAALDVPGERRMLVPSESAFLGTLHELGLVEQRRLAHMRLGRLELPGMRDRLLAQVSFATG
jgi:GNAT superfamily N-acetyltransferase